MTECSSFFLLKSCYLCFSCKCYAFLSGLVRFLNPFSLVLAFQQFAFTYFCNNNNNNSWNLRRLYFSIPLSLYFASIIFFLKEKLHYVLIREKYFVRLLNKNLRFCALWFITKNLRFCALRTHYKKFALLWSVDYENFSLW